MDNGAAAQNTDDEPIRSDDEKSTDNVSGEAASSDPRKLALAKKSSGNDAFKKKQYPAAAELYSAAIGTYPTKDETLATFYCNRAACYLHIGWVASAHIPKFYCMQSTVMVLEVDSVTNDCCCCGSVDREHDRVVQDCTAALELKSKYSKALNRRAQVRLQAHGRLTF